MSCFGALAGERERFERAGEVVTLFRARGCRGDNGVELVELHRWSGFLAVADLNNSSSWGAGRLVGVGGLAVVGGFFA